MKTEATNWTRNNVEEAVLCQDNSRPENASCVNFVFVLCRLLVCVLACGVFLIGHHFTAVSPDTTGQGYCAIRAELFSTWRSHRIT